VDLIIAYLIYPGLLPSIVFAFDIRVYRDTTPARACPPMSVKTILSVDGFAALLSTLLAIGAATCMPWPFNGAYTSIARHYPCGQPSKPPFSSPR
jgi:hypothetical protein